MGRIVSLTEMVGRTLVKITDDTDWTTVIEGEGVPDLQE